MRLHTSRISVIVAALVAEASGATLPAEAAARTEALKPALKPARLKPMMRNLAATAAAKPRKRHVVNAMVSERGVIHMEDRPAPTVLETRGDSIKPARLKPMMRNLAATAAAKPRTRHVVNATFSELGDIHMEDLPARHTPTALETRGRLMRARMAADSSSVYLNRESHQARREIRSYIAVLIGLCCSLTLVGLCIFRWIATLAGGRASPNTISLDYSHCRRDTGPSDPSTHDTDSDDSGAEVDMGETYSCRTDATFEQALNIPENEAQLKKVLKSAGIDTSKWAGDAVHDLQNQLLKGECWLTYAGKSGQPKTLVRRVRLLVLKISAMFPDGIRILKCIGIQNNATGEFKSKQQECAKKLALSDDTDEVIPALLLHELHLPIDWQQKHLRVVHTDKTFLFSGADRGKSLSGLISHYFTETVCMRLEDINAESIGRKLKLPGGDGSFEIMDDDGIFTNKTRYWQWKQATEDELSEFTKRARRTDSKALCEC